MPAGLRHDLWILISERAAECQELIAKLRMDSDARA